MSEDPLALDPETMRRLGYRTVDMLVDWLADESAPCLQRVSPAEMRERLAGPPPEVGEPYEAVLERLRDDALRFSRERLAAPVQPRESTSS